MEIAIIIYDGFDELDAIGPFEVFANAHRAGAACTVSLRTVDDVDLVRASHGVGIEPDGPLAAVDPDLLVVPGGGWTGREDRGAWAEAERGEIPALLEKAAEDGIAIAGVCTGGMLLASAGLLSGRPAITHGSAIDELERTDATVVRARVVDDGDRLTAGGVTAGLELACHLVEREFGATIADRVTETMEYERRGPVHPADGAA